MAIPVGIQEIIPMEFKVASGAKIRTLFGV
jgi:hypothetical protein